MAATSAMVMPPMKNTSLTAGSVRVAVECSELFDPPITDIKMEINAILRNVFILVHYIYEIT